MTDPEGILPRLETHAKLASADERYGDAQAFWAACRYISDERAWVIEHGASEVSRPRYWGGVKGWTYENLEAVRFSREADARSQAEAMDDGFPGNYRIAEHGWG